MRGQGSREERNSTTIFNDMTNRSRGIGTSKAANGAGPRPRPILQDLVRGVVVDARSLAAANISNQKSFWSPKNEWNEYEV